MDYYNTRARVEYRKAEANRVALGLVLYLIALPLWFYVAAVFGRLMGWN